MISCQHRWMIRRLRQILKNWNPGSQSITFSETLTPAIGLWEMLRMKRTCFQKIRHPVRLQKSYLKPGTKSNIADPLLPDESCQVHYTKCIHQQYLLTKNHLNMKA